MTEAEIADMMSSIPFLGNVHTKLVAGNVQFFAYLGYTKEEFVSIVKRNPAVFGVTRDKLDKLLRKPMSWGIPLEVVKRLIYENPEYLTVCPYDMLPLKIKLLKHFHIS